jgi:DNA-binding MarR family transcriptional regulator
MNKPSSGVPVLKALLDALRQIHPEFPLQYALCFFEISMDEGLSVTTLAKRVNLSLSTVSRIIGALSDNRQSGKAFGLVEVRFAPQSRRQKELYISSNGKKTLKNISALVTGTIERYK